MTFCPLGNELKELLKLYDTWVERLALGGVVDPVYSVKHFLEVFAFDPESYREDEVVDEKTLTHIKPKPKELTKRRIKNIIKRILDGDEFYTNFSPRISWAEIDALGKLGFWLQTEHTYGAQAGPIAVYPLNREEFNEKAKTYLEGDVEK